MLHQFIDRDSGTLRDEPLFGDRTVRFLYGPARESAPRLFSALTSPRFTSLLGTLQYDLMTGASVFGNRAFVEEANVDLNETVLPAAELKTLRAFFERQIRFWATRPMPEGEGRVVCPSDSRVLLMNLAHAGALFLKEKFFVVDELVGGAFGARFTTGDAAVFRLTPEKYHYNHLPVSGVVREVTVIDGRMHACHPHAVVVEATPFSRNRRTVTVIDTDVPDGSQVGLVAMVEVTALLIGEVVQVHSRERYQDPKNLVPGAVVRRGEVKSLFRPGSSTVVLLFEEGRVRFDDDLVNNQRRLGHSRFSAGFGRPLLETDVRVRQSLGRSTSLFPQVRS